MKKLSLLLLSTTLMISGCSGAQSPDVVDEKEITAEEIAESRIKPMDLAWEDLMPEGEETRLAEMYTDFYEELEAQMAGGAQSLSEAADGKAADFDVNAIAEGAANDTMEQIGTFNVVSSLDGLNVRIPGYVVPLDFNAENKYKEFLLVPYFGACLHTPPPPPNQIIYVKADPGVTVPNIQEPFWLEGRMTTGKFTSDLASTAYEVSLSKLEKYDY